MHHGVYKALEEEVDLKCLCTPGCFPALCQVHPRIFSTICRRILLTSDLSASRR
jgi:hypothetical protein